MGYTVLYKFLKQKHALSFMQTGELRIGTLYKYRKCEKYGTEIGDQGEGSKRTVCVDSVDSATQVLAHPFLSNFIRVSPGAEVRIHDALFTTQEESKDLYIYSMTESLIPATAQEFGYDSCLVIKQPMSFFSCIDAALRLVTSVENGFRVEKCIYISRTQLYSLEHGIAPAAEHQAHPAFIKDTRYAYQREVRTIWQPTEAIIQPIILRCPQATKYCEPCEMGKTW